METIIEIRNLHKFYGSHEVLKGIDLEIKSGQIIGYIGPNGAGKSTTIKILTGLLIDYAGEVKINGLEIKDHSLEIKSLIGYVPENAILYDSLSPMEYFRFVGGLHQLDLDKIKSKSQELLRVFGLADNRNERMTSFSKGMKQKVLLISGMLHNPQILFLDEPLSGLDANSVILIKEILNQMRTVGKTIFYSSHIMDVVEKLCDRIILINSGLVIADGTFEELKNAQNSASLEQMFNLLTGNNEHIALAAEFVEIIKE
ncbi:ABC transporter ATP-binding protein [Lacihabitans sp. LS3-19]|uniref:ABC transporter ATP-binding protein n=1 Tax=Lacihabitans sp. LS3-19 TaxID=2487335 RepID=UPI0020CD8BB6|nr:ABC transporter ATP-binding protein [Lacihabitans sp. LS3-19]MCP9767298.1 ABC transporter ATP-binding protein [Lacihabitans sp. LS3-19]